MGLFGSKKKIPETLPRKPRILSLPEFPKYESSMSELPRYDIGHEARRAAPEPINYRMPEELPQKPLPPFTSLSPDFEIPQRLSSQEKLMQEEQEEWYPKTYSDTEQFSRKASVPAEDAIFVRIEEYRKSVEKIQKVKDLVKDAEKILSEVQALKSEEDKHLASWHQEITEIKTKLMEIDKDLFEYR